MTIKYSHVDNDAGADAGIGADNGGSITFEHSHIDNTGSISAFTGLDDGTAGAIYICDSTITNTGAGTISANGACAVVQLSDATIIGGTLFSGDGGAIDVVAAGGADTSTLEGGAVISNSTISVPTHEASTEWHNAGIAVTAGEVITISASGTISIGNGVNLDGHNDDNETPAGNANINTSDSGFLAPGLTA
jgi:hypothetical protein